MMADKRRTYTEEFKRETVRLITEEGYGVAATARNLGLNVKMVGRWKREWTPPTLGPTAGRGPLSLEQAELARLREENKRLRMERDILKKALGCFASPSP